MTIEMKHTKIPWHKSGNMIFQDLSAEFIATAKETVNAAFMVRAVNCHDELVAAIGVTRDYVEDVVCCEPVRGLIGQGSWVCLLQADFRVQHRQETGTPRQESIRRAEVFPLT